MLKRALVFSVAIVWLLAGVTAMASAAQNVANPSQKGSLLIFPKIDVSGERDTIITISNDYSRGVPVKCYWVDDEQNIEDFQFLVTLNQPIWFRASDGLGTGYLNGASNNPIAVPPFMGEKGVGELKCWAVTFEDTAQVSFNHLYGKATIIDFTDGSAWEYNAWSFSARGVNITRPVGTAGNLQLTGANLAYDACPQYLLGNFFATPNPSDRPPRYIDLDDMSGAFHVNKTDLTLVPCKQDLRQDRIPTCTKAKFDIWNENETKYTGAYRCIKCWFEGFLDDYSADGITKPYGFGGEKFTLDALHTTLGRFRVQGVASTVCNGKFSQCTTQVDSPLLGVISTTGWFSNGKIETFGTNLHGAGTGSGFIYWDVAGDTPEAPGR